ncbi:hypothetical protein [Jeotgalibaca caeni]|uniref:DUF1659 domain-containing protein n=1 Tax=Jeotgalibaca caeni TaxID=3028623 RepID=UPI00237D4A07|nr:hypothetical protein [Jeotgalibaca caeni]MDE1548179.1 hypothetical protein [Jeotgalibaca caeni]
MLKQWEEANVELYFNDYENEKEVKQSFSDLKENATPDQIGSFQNAIGALISLPTAHAIVVEKHRYVQA